uniref:Na+/H+ antiporter NhaC family protein n=1 Tax=Roseivirga sp. TaxID=1964215 RepID=UPI0040471FCE
MEIDVQATESKRSISFYGGAFGALLPFLVFVTGVIIIALSGAPDERGFWPVLILSLAVGLLMAKDRKEYSEIVIEGMSNKIVMVMITAWILASTIGILMQITGFVDALIWTSAQMNLGGTGFVIATFIICCIVSLSTGSSFATILICSPLLYPVGGQLGAHLPTLAGAIIGGATVGDFVAPISDTTIVSALSQKAELGATVKSRIKYIVPAAILALIAYAVSANLSSTDSQEVNSSLLGNPTGLPMLLVPALIIFMFLRGKHLFVGLITGLMFGIALGLALGLLPLDKLISLDLENFTAKSFIIDGINRAVGISFFTILLMGLVATLKASGLIKKLVDFASERSKTKRHAETWITGTISAAVLLTTHSAVAILMVSEFANTTGEKMGISKTRRANLLSLVACTFPFLLPYFIPIILMTNMTHSGEEFGIPSVPPLQIGMYNFVSWALLAIVILVVIFGFGRNENPDQK